QFFQLAAILPVLGILFFSLHPHFSDGSWLAFTAVLAIIVTIYGIATRLWVMAAAGQLYIAYSVLQFLHLAVLGPGDAKPVWYLALVPAAALLGLSWIASRNLLGAVERSQWL